MNSQKKRNDNVTSFIKLTCVNEETNPFKVALKIRGEADYVILDDDYDAIHILATGIWELHYLKKALTFATKGLDLIERINSASSYNVLGAPKGEKFDTRVYCLLMDSDLMKIRITDNIKSRVSVIEHASGSFVTDGLLHGKNFPRSFALDLENPMHERFADRRKRGEYFQINLQEAHDRLQKHSPLIRLHQA